MVAELDDWLAREATTLKHYPADDVDTGLLQRARDEIVALRARLDVLPDIRGEALEEAATLCERVPGDPPPGDFFAKAIRTLKGRGDD